MEESKRRPLMIAIIVVCVVVAAAITFTRGSKSSGTKRFAGKEQWMKCINPDCGAEYTMDMKKYLDWKQENVSIASQGTIGMVCGECEDEKAFGAVKCEKCEHVFFKGAAGADFSDTCPECDYSKRKDTREKAREAEGRKRVR